LNTDDNDGNLVAYNTAANTFEINGTFVATSTGDWNTNSLTNESVGTAFSGNTGIASSNVLANFLLNNNSTATVIASPDTYQAIDITSGSFISSTQRIKLIDTVAAIYKYIDNETISIPSSIILHASKTGSTQRYDFAISINGGVPADIPFAPLEIKTEVRMTALNQSITLANDDEFQVFVRAVGHSDNLTITDFSIIATTPIQ